MGGSLTTPTAPQMTDVNPNRCGEPMNPLKKTHTPLGREEVSSLEKYKKLVPISSLLALAIVFKFFEISYSLLRFKV